MRRLINAIVAIVAVSVRRNCTVVAGLIKPRQHQPLHARLSFRAKRFSAGKCGWNSVGSWTDGCSSLLRELACAYVECRMTWRGMPSPALPALVPAFARVA